MIVVHAIVVHAALMPPSGRAASVALPCSPHRSGEHELNLSRLFHGVASPSMSRMVSSLL